MGSHDEIGIDLAEIQPSFLDGISYQLMQQWRANDHDIRAPTVGRVGFDPGVTE
ncbi:hypothetical protein SAMCFNEI73_Ch3091 [Sinorhizobium americanum]|uniref:Uncharacterized protein n=1 Tax=Sinorhizobium americanum TaxID=194963 RepID=A0A1L3LQM7_9HYPH|nr:hypothetical protein SAMCCGM7_Ch2968 [Sinorhizobium americanum CCGM7]APG92356.1 hypothetical protein SAMCFNEI73_Ch3091 [Sinorhizobium americanum]